MRMSKKRRYKFKVMSISKPLASCYYCQSGTNAVLFDAMDYSEVWCCEKCAWEIAKKTLKGKSPKKRKKIENPQQLLVDWSQNIESDGGES